MTLSEIAESISDASDERTKPLYYYDRYEPYFAKLSDQPVKVLELGVHMGDSLKVLSSYFRHGTIVGADIKDPGIDFSKYPNAVFVTGDQREGDQLRTISSTYAPEGWDIIIDDASHYGTWSLLSYEALFPYLKPGGLFVVEDWATAYWDDWPDGSRYQRITPIVPKDHIPKRIPSHDFGMVGFVKYLVDELVARPATTRSSPIIHERRFEWMQIATGFAILKKASG